MLTEPIGPTPELTVEELASLVARRADVNLHLINAAGIHRWVPAQITGRTRGRTGVRVEVRRADGSVMAFAYPLGEARRVLRIASLREGAQTSVIGSST